MYPISNKDVEVSEALLSGAELTCYKEKGWIVPKWEFSKELISEMREEYKTLLKKIAIFLQIL